MSNTPKDKHIALIGPTYPYKGGISQYSTLFFQNLNRHFSAEMHTYKSLYPSWLFTGKSEPDPSSQAMTADGAIHDLSFLNPFSFYTLGRKLRHTASHVVAAWWTIAWMPHLCLLALGLNKKIPLIFWCLNVMDHENRPVKRLLTRFVLKQTNLFLADNIQDQRQILKWVPNARVAVSPLPLLSSPAITESKAPSPLPARKNSQTRRLLFFGFVRPYKGLMDLIRALPEILKSHPVELVIAGEFWLNAKDEITAELNHLQITGHVIILDRYIPNEEIGPIYRDCDLVIMPYRKAAGSGIVNLAVELERPLVVTNTGALPDSIIPGKTGLIAEPSNPSSLAETIVKALQTPFKPEDLAEAHRKRACGWDDFIAALATLLQ